MSNQLLNHSKFSHIRLCFLPGLSTPTPFVDFYKLWVVLRYIAKFVLDSIRYTRVIDLQAIELHSKMLQICLIFDLF